jgi:cytochrome P450
MGLPPYHPFAPDPSPEYPALRETCPVRRYRDNDFEFFALSRHADVREALSDAGLFSMRYGQMHTYTPGQGLTVDPPAHTALRRMLNPMFTVRGVAQFEARIREIAQSLIDGIASRGEADFCADFAAPFAVGVAAEVLGVEADRHEDLRRWTFDFTVAYNTGDQALEAASRGAICGYLAGRMADRRASLARGEAAPDDLVTLLVSAEHPDGGQFPEPELLATALLLLVGGVDTTSFLLGNCLYRLLGERSLWEAVCGRPELIAVAVEESLRFDSPVFGTFRTNERAVCLRGVDVPKDSKIQMLYASANRDAEVFEDPDRFRLDRDLDALRRDNLAFGAGIHNCIGSSAARLSARTAVEALVERLPGIELAGEPVRFVTAPGAITANNGFTKLPVRWPTSGARP